MKPLAIDERRLCKLATACDLIDDERPRGPQWKDRHAAAYATLARALDLAAKNARTVMTPPSPMGGEDRPKGDPIIPSA